MIGITAKIAEFFSSLLFALFGSAIKVVLVGLLILALLGALVMAAQFMIGKRDTRE